MNGKFSDKFWTLPNAISLLRLIFGSPVTLILYHNGYEYAWVVFSLFVATDWLDGCISRRWGSGSSWGVILDPLADQFLVLPIFWMFYWWGKINCIVPAILLAREALMALTRFLAKHDLPANLLGKTKVAAEYIGIAFLFMGGQWYYFGLLMFFPILILAVLSLLQYAFYILFGDETCWS